MYVHSNSDSASNPEPDIIDHHGHKHLPTPSGSEDEDLNTSLHTRTKVAALMAGIVIPPGSRHDRFKKRYAQYTPERTLGMRIGGFGLVIKFF